MYLQVVGEKDLRIIIHKCHMIFGPFQHVFSTQYQNSFVLIDEIPDHGS